MEWIIVGVFVLMAIGAWDTYRERQFEAGSGVAFREIAWTITKIALVFVVVVIVLNVLRG